MIDKVAIKNLFYIPAFIGGAIGCPAETCQVLVTLMFVDMITGIMKSGKLNGWRSIKSSLMAFGFTSKLALLLVPVVIALAGKGINIDLLFLATGAITVLVLSETYSILGNIQAIRTGKEVPEFDVVGIMIKKIRETLLLLSKENINKRR